MVLSKGTTSNAATGDTIGHVYPSALPVGTYDVSNAATHSTLSSALGYTFAFGTTPHPRIIVNPAPLIMTPDPLVVDTPSSHPVVTFVTTGDLYAVNGVSYLNEPNPAALAGVLAHLTAAVNPTALDADPTFVAAQTVASNDPVLVDANISDASNLSNYLAAHASSLADDPAAIAYVPFLAAVLNLNFAVDPSNVAENVLSTGNPAAIAYGLAIDPAAMAAELGGTYDPVYTALTNNGLSASNAAYLATYVTGGGAQLGVNPGFVTPDTYNTVVTGHATATVATGPTTYPVTVGTLAVNDNYILEFFNGVDLVPYNSTPPTTTTQDASAVQVLMAVQPFVLNNELAVTAVNTAPVTLAFQSPGTPASSTTTPSLSDEKQHDLAADGAAEEETDDSELQDIRAPKVPKIGRNA